MNSRVRYYTSWFCLAASLLTGCAPVRPIFLNNDGDLSHYRGLAQEIENPLVTVDRLGEVENALPPLMISDPQTKEIWDLTLPEAVRTALANNKTLKVLNSFQSGNITISGISSSAGTDRLFGASVNETGQTIYDPALAESDPRSGVEAALSQFDATLTSSMIWQRNDRPLNFFITGFQQPVFQQDLGTHTTELSKPTASGGTVTIRNHNNYEMNNNTQNLFSSVFNSDIEAEFRHPLLQGAGVQFNRIAGNSGVTGIYSGVLIARLQTDIQLVEFEAQVRNMVMDIEKAYWTLYNNYRRLDANIAGRDSTLETWRTVRAKLEAQVPGGGALQEASARQQYFQFRALVETALKDLYAAEGALRYLIGLSPTDGRLIRPIDEPTTAKVSFDWYESLNESLARTCELREQKWRVKESEMRLQAAKNFLLPRLDVVGTYRARGMGEKLLDTTRQDDTTKAVPGRALQLSRYNSAYQTLTQGDYQEWQIGLQGTYTIGQRRAMAGVRNEELRLARRRAIMQEEELIISHYLAAAMREMDSSYKLAQTNFNRRVAAQKELEVTQERYHAGDEQYTFDRVLDAQRRLADAEQSYYNSLIDYNTQIALVHFRKGSLLEYNNVHLSEGPWTDKAYRDALKRAQERDSGLFIDYGFTQPKVMSAGPVEQMPGTVYNSLDQKTGTPTPAATSETIPTDVPTPAEPVPPGNRIETQSYRAAFNRAGEANPIQSLGYPQSPSLKRYETQPFDPTAGIDRIAPVGSTSQREFDQR